MANTTRFQYWLLGSPLDPIGETQVDTSRFRYWSPSGPLQVTFVGPNLSAFNISQNILWNVEETSGFVSVSSSLLWNVYSPVSADVNADWNIDGAIFIVGQSIWNTRQVLSSSQSSTWSSYQSLSAIEISTIWDVFNIVSPNSVSTVWNVYQPFTAIRDIRWTGEESILVNVNALWSAYNKVTGEVDSTWDITAPFTNSVSALWTIAASSVWVSTEILWTAGRPFHIVLGNVRWDIITGPNYRYGYETKTFRLSVTQTLPDCTPIWNRNRYETDTVRLSVTPLSLPTCTATINRGKVLPTTVYIPRRVVIPIIRQTETPGYFEPRSGVPIIWNDNEPSTSHVTVDIDISWRIEPTADTSPLAVNFVFGSLDTPAPIPHIVTTNIGILTGGLTTVCIPTSTIEYTDFSIGILSGACIDITTTISLSDNPVTSNVELLSGIRFQQVIVGLGDNGAGTAGITPTAYEENYGLDIGVLTGWMETVAIPVPDKIESTSFSIGLLSGSLN